MKCPKGSYVNAEGTDCTCPAGHYRAAADQAPGFKKIACKPCMARNAYVAEDGHTQESCKSCAAPQVANKDHSGCGKWQCLTHTAGDISSCGCGRSDAKCSVDGAYLVITAATRTAAVGVGNHSSSITPRVLS